jgi:hypothetical protein
MTTLPQLLRHGRATVAVAVLFAGAPPLAAGFAVAAEPVAAEPVAAEPVSPLVPVQGRGPEVVFQAERAFGLRCRAESEPETLSVSAESEVRVVNRTGRRAVLIIDGVARGEIPEGSSAEVLFHHGPVIVALRPICVLAAEAALRVDVEPPALSASGLSSPSPFGRPGPAEGYLPGLGWSGRPAAEVSGARPVRDRGPTGLLALVAAVCVFGVSAGAIRAINAQRATRCVVA